MEFVKAIFWVIIMLLYVIWLSFLCIKKNWILKEYPSYLEVVKPKNGKISP